MKTFLKKKKCEQLKLINYLQIKNCAATIAIHSGKYGGRVRGPRDIVNGLLEIEGHEGLGGVGIPEFDGPIRGAGDENVVMEGVPLDSVPKTKFLNFERRKIDFGAEF